MNTVFNFSFTSSPGPNNLKLWLGTSLYFDGFFDLTSDIVNYYRQLYAIQYGIVHYVREVSVMPCLNRIPDEQEDYMFIFYLQFFKTKVEMQEYQDMNNRFT